MQINQRQKQTSSYLETRSDCLSLPFPHISLRPQTRNNNSNSNKKGSNSGKNFISFSKHPLEKQASCTRGYRFQKEERFKNTASQCYNFCSLEVPRTSSKLSCSFGYGKKQPISKSLLRQKQSIPSPDKYMVKSCLSTRGVSFSCATRQSQTRQFLPHPHHNDTYSPHFTEDHPSFIYDIRQKIKARPISFTRRPKIFPQQVMENYATIPGPQYYPNERKMENIGGIDRGVTFKSGQRLDFGRPINENPGPQYTVAGFCDKFVNLKEKNIPSNKSKQKTKNNCYGKPKKHNRLPTY